MNEILDLFIENLLGSNFMGKHIVKREHFFGSQVHQRVAGDLLPKLLVCLSYFFW